MLPTFPSEDSLETLDCFPYPEGYQYEFKENIVSQDKLIPTICAFLNNQGGFIVIGVRDCDLVICGLPKSATEKKIDMFLLSLDTIFHQTLIAKESGDAIDFESLQIKRIITHGRRLLIIQVVPLPNTKYLCRDGSKWIRVSASNYRVSTSKLLHQVDLQRHLFSQQRKLQTEYKDLVENLQAELCSGASKLEAVSTELIWTRAQLYEKILKEKKEADYALSSENQSKKIYSLYYLLCGIKFSI